GPLLDVRAVRAAPKDGTHLVGDTRQARHEDLERRGIEGHDRPSTHAPAGPGLAVQPSGTQSVQSPSTTTSGPCTRRRATAGSSSTSNGPGRVARARSATTSTGAPTREKPLRRWCSAGKSSGVRTVSSWLCPTYRQATNVS